MTVAAAHGLGPGFADPPVDAARMFRFVLDAMARPGRPRPVTTATQPPAPLDPVAASVALTLVDYDTPLWLDERLRRDGVVDYLRFHTGSPMTDRPGNAAFALIGDPDSMPPLDAFAQGSVEYPDRSATIILQVDRLAGEGPVELAGPGIRTVESFCAEPVPARLWRELADNHGRFPLGVDLIFVAPGSVAGLPRSTAVEIVGAS